MNGISVIVCCYNSAARLPATLQHLSGQITETNLDWEIILVDNNSTDNTATVASDYWQQLPVGKQLSIVSEPTPGLSFARDKGVHAAMYNIIIFCDDDNLLEPGYVQQAYNLVNKTKGLGYAVWGGKIVPYFNSSTTVPSWFEEEKANYVVGEQGIKSGDITARGYIWGAGMVLLKSVYLTIISQRFPSLLRDRTGQELSSGGDAEICLRTIIAGYKLYYDASLLLNHYIPEARLTPAYNASLVEGFKTSNALLNKYKLFIHYTLHRNRFYKILYGANFMVKYCLHTIGVRSLTNVDETALKIFFKSKFPDADIAMMYTLSSVKTTKINTV